MPVDIEDLLLVSVIIVAGFLAAVAFYESLSTRDVLVARCLRVARRISRRAWFIGVVYVATVGLGIPILVLVWTNVLAIGLVFVGSLDRVESAPFIATAIVAAARVLAYLRATTAHELAKAIPLSFAFLMLTGGALNLDEKLARIVERPEATDLTAAMVVFLLVLEVTMRLLTDGSHAVLGALRRRHGIEDERGWRATILAVVRPAPSGDRAAP